MKMCHFMLWLFLATATLQTYKPHSMASVVNNGHCASTVILFGYFWMYTSLPHGTGMRRCPTYWTQPLMKSSCQVLESTTKEYASTSLLASVLAMHSRILSIHPVAIMDVIAPRDCITSVQLKHVPCHHHKFSQFVRNHGFLQQMKCLLQKQQRYSGYILTPTFHNAREISFFEWTPTVQKSTKTLEISAT